MHRTPHLLLCITALVLLAATFAGATARPVSKSARPAPQDEKEAEREAQPTDDEPAKPRVLIRVNRSDVRQGYLEREDNEVIVIRWAGKVESFMKNRIVEIIRLTEPEEGQAGIVMLRDGRYYEGVVVEDAWSYVTLSIEGVLNRYPREAVHRVILQSSVEQMYEELRKAIPKESFNNRLELANWLIGKRRYELAERELVELLTDKPDMYRATELLRFVRAQIKLEEGNRNAPTLDGAPVRGDDNPRGPIAGEEMLPTEILTPEDVNLIRVYEIDFRRPPKVQIEPETIRAMITEYAAHPAIPASSTERTALFREEPIAIARMMLQDLRARELYPKINVLSEPYALNIFRQRVHNTWLINNCATSRCHGGLKAGRLFLHRKGHKDDRVRYTNLLILERLDLGDEWPLVNYEQPLMSKIIQYGLPRTEARLAHPDVPGWAPVFGRSNKRLLDDAIEWIESMYQPRPDYPIAYEPPDLRKETPRDPLGGDPERVPR